LATRTTPGVEATAPASPAQEAVWFATQSRGGQDPNVMARALSLRGPLNVEAFTRAVETIYARHETLRSSLVERDGALQQVVHEPGPVPLVFCESNSEEECRRFLQGEAARSFDLGSAPLWRMYLCAVGPDEHVWAILVHHVIADAWSLEVIQTELATLYTAYCGGHANPLAPLPGQYREFANAQRMRESLGARAAAREHWARELQLPLAPTGLPADHAKKGTGSPAASVVRRLDADAVDALTRLASSRHATLFVALQALVKVLLYRYTGEADVTVATPVSGRDRQQDEALVGLFVNLLPLRDRLDPATPFATLLDQVAETAARAFAHRQVPIASLLAELKADGHEVPSLFNVFVALQNVAASTVSTAGLEISPFAIADAFAKTDLTFEFVPDGEGVTLHLSYDAGLWTPETMAGMAKHFSALLSAAVAAPETSIGTLPWLSAKETRALAQWTATATDYPREAAIPSLVAAQVAQRPEAVAVVAGTERVSYGELAARAHQLAGWLQARGVGAESRVGVCLDRSVDLIVCLLGVLEAGGAYVPLDPAYPAERLSYIIGDTDLSVVLATTATATALPAASGVTVLCLDAAAEEIAAAPPPAPVSIDGASLAYLMYTSGSTGLPKGVAIPHRAIVRLVRDTDYVQVGPGDVVAHASTPSFDAATFEIWACLINGGTIHIVSREDLLDAERLAAVIRAGRIGTLFVTTALFNRLVQSQPTVFSGLDNLLFGGEAVDPQWVRAVLAAGPPRRLLHVYGPTECTTFATWATVTEVPTGATTVPIGRPIANTTAYVLDAARQLVPAGVVGELHIGGDGLARGYWRDTALTEERFVDVPGLGRLYRTGDRVRWTEDGQLEFVGRHDHQIKLRGFRIELGEIEAAIRRVPGVRDAHVAILGTGDTRRIVAYLVGAAPVETMQSELARLLPAYMLPHDFVALDALPLSATGKVDRARLPAPAAPTVAAVRLMTPVEELLAGLWSEVLQVEVRDPEADFFALGGHSLLAMQVVSRIRTAFGVEVPLSTVFSAPSLAVLAGEISTQRQPRRLPPIAHIPDTPPTLTAAQRRMWFMAEGDGSTIGATYTISAALGVEGELDEQALRLALVAVTARHDSLRVNVRNVGGAPEVTLRDPYDPLKVVTLREAVTDATLAQLAHAHAAEPFDLATDPLMRLTLVRDRDAAPRALLFSVHHLIADGWSLSVLVRDLAVLYAGGSLSPLPVTMADYAVWERDWLAGPERARQLAYWRAQLADAPSLLELPTDFPRPPVKGYAGAQVPVHVPADLVSKLRAVGQAEGATLAMTVLAGLIALLHRYSGSTDVVVGSPVAQRPQRETEGLIGLLVNTVALRAPVTGTESFAALIRAVRQVALDAYGHSDVPFDQLLEDLQPTRSLSYSPIYQVMCAVQTAPVAAVQLGAARTRSLAVAPGTAKVDLLLNVGEEGGALSGVWEYRTDLWTPETIARLAQHFELLLTGAAESPDTPVGRLPLLTSDESAALARWTATDAMYPRDASIAALVASQSLERPGDTAIVDGDEVVSYRELMTRARRLAGWLQAHGVGHETRVGVCLDRSADLIVTLLAVLEAGGVYVPLDPAYPHERLTHLMGDTGLSVVLATTTTASSLPAVDGVTVLCLDEAAEQVSAAPPPRPVPVTGASLAYLMYTSGSTGQPKGVAITHRAIARLVLGTDYVQIRPGDVVAHASTPAFDAATFEIWAPLVNGGTVHVVRREDLLDGTRLAAVIRGGRVGTLFVTTALFNRLVQLEPAVFAGLDNLLFGGEAVDPQWVRAALAAGPPRRLLHVYGPTECTTFATWAVVTEVAAGATTVPIGRPIANTTAYVLDGQRQLVPIGVVGELHLGGDGLAKGYWQDPKLTADRFVDVAGLGRLYRTGDRVRWRADGQIEFVGRMDSQVKLRGFRIEPGEVEACLRRQAAVRDAAVLVVGEAEHRRLVAYVAGEPGVLEGAVLKESLQRQLPAFMVPSQFVVLDELPLTRNGKLDRARLPEPQPSAIGSAGEAPTSPEEQQLAAIWADVLRVPQVGRHDNFFELGGDSILSIQIVARARAQGLQIAVDDVFKHQTVAELAPRLGRASQAPAHVVVTGASVPLTPIQHWFLERGLDEPWHFNQAVMLTPRERLSPEALATALAALAGQHAVLRCRFTRTDRGWTQQYGGHDQALPVHHEDLRPLPPATQSAELLVRANTWQRSLDLADGPLARAVLFELDEGQRLLWIVHHLAVDGVSWRVLLGDLQVALDAVARGDAPCLPPPSAPFELWSRFLVEYGAGAACEASRDHWRALPAALPLPVDRPDGEPTQQSTASVSLQFEQDETQALLEDVHAAYGLQINDVLLTALARTLRSWTKRAGCLIDLEGHGRVELPGAPDVSRTVGWFTTVYPVHLELPGAEDDLGASLKAIKETLRSIPASGISYGVLRYLAADPIAEVSAPIAFNYLGQFDQVLDAGAFSFAPEGAGETHTALGRRPHLIDVEAMVVGRRLAVSWSYSANQFSAATIETLAQSFAQELRRLVAHCRNPLAAGYTSSDFPLAQLAQPSLDALAAQHGRNIAAVYPLSPLQQGLVLHTLHEDPREAAYLEQLTCRVDGDVDPDRWRAAWQRLVERHPILRTAVDAAAMPPLQVVHRAVAIDFETADWPDVAADSEALDRRLSQIRRGFPIAVAPLMRWHLARVADRRWQFTVSFHHVLLDGWSLSMLFGEFLRLLADPQSSLPARPSYQDYIGWLQRQDAGGAKAHWQAHLAGIDSPTPLPLEARAGAIAPDHYAEALFSLDAEASGRIQRCAARQRVTVNTLLQAAWALLLHRYSGEADIVFGVTVSGRDIDLAGADQIIGLCINTVPLRLRVDETTVDEWVPQVQARHQANARHAAAALSDIQRWTSVPSGVPLFRSLLVFENYPMEQSLASGARDAVQFSDLRALDRTSYPLAVIASMAERLDFRVGYDASLFTPDRIAQIVRHLGNLLESLSQSASGMVLRDLEMLDASDLERLHEWGREQQPAMAAETLLTRFDSIVARYADRPAVTCGERRLTYRELDQDAERVAVRLRALGAGPDRVVLLIAERSEDLLVGLLGILKSGAAYLYCEPDTPRQRLDFMAADANAVAVVADRVGLATAPAGLPCVRLDDSSTLGTLGTPGTLAIPLRPDHLAYVIYTSGSTGQPKGVMVTHANVARLFTTTESTFTPSERDVWTLFHSCSFDFSVWEIWGAWLYGGCVVVVPHEISRDPVRFVELLEREHVTMLSQTPSAFYQLIPIAQRRPRPLSLRFVVFGGEALDLPALEPWFEVHGDAAPTLVNMYGITETTVHVTWHVLQRSDTSTTASVIGRPLADLSVHLLDAEQRLAPPGAAGEIYVGGAGLARGYLNRPELTSERFVMATVGTGGDPSKPPSPQASKPPSPQAPKPPGRFYRSGDLARWRGDGVLEYLGRGDHQVKIRGYRIELGEIESALVLHPGVREASVAVHGTGTHASLAAFVVSAPEVDATALQAWLALRLPSYMVPSRVVMLDKMPLTSNGKVDRRALAALVVDGSSVTDAIVSPRNEIEQQVAAIWQQALGLASVGVESALFELGGHSLTAMQILARVHDVLGADVSLRRFLEVPTVAGLARAVADAPPPEQSPIRPAVAQPHYPLSFEQQQVWLDQLLAPAAAYNVFDLVPLDDVNEPALQKSVEQLIERHEILRTAFIEVDGEPRQQVHATGGIELLRHTCRTEAERQAFVSAEIGRPFALDRLPLFRVTVIDAADGPPLLLWVAHHLICDAWSLDLLQQEWRALYQAPGPKPLAPLPVQYKDYAQWQSGQTFARERRFWNDTLAGAPRHMELPHDRHPGAQRQFSGARQSTMMPREVARGLRGLARAHDTTVSNVLLAAFNLLVSQLTGQPDVCIVTAVANRSRPELARVAGLFVNLVPVRTRLSDDMDVDQLIAEVTQNMSLAIDHGAYPFSLLVRETGRMAHDDLRPFMDVAYVYQREAGIEAASSEPASSFGFAKFDLGLFVRDGGGDQLELTLDYDSELFFAGTIAGYLDRLAGLATALAEAHDEGAAAVTAGEGPA
jgi:amino acid adenylation domain-containing protein/non-ribosomal peptide synthase protein (TIGR01720 family)